MKLRKILLRNFILPVGDLLFGQQMISRLKFLESAQSWPREQVLQWRSRDLISLIRVAYAEVPFYRSLMDQQGLRPQDIKDVSDLVKMPVVTKDILRKAYPDLCTRPTGQKTYQASTSGSTGRNFFVREDAFTAGWYRATFLLELEWAGWAIGEPHLQTGMTLKRSLDRRLKDRLLGCHYMSAYNLDDAHLDAILNEMDRHHLQHLWGYPGSLYYIARRAMSRGWNTPLKTVVSWGDTLYPHYRSMIEKAFGSRVTDTYGCAEGFHIAAQCEHGNYHIHALDVILEFLDDDGLPVPPGTPGNVVITRLHPGPMPFIRYAVGDITIPSPEIQCPCGRGFPLMKGIQGRDADMILTPSGNRLIVHYFTGILEHFPQIASFQVVQNAPDQLVLKVVPETEISDHQAQKIIQAVKSRGAQDMQVVLEQVDHIPLPPSGKHRFIINNMPKAQL